MAGTGRFVEWGWINWGAMAQAAGQISAGLLVLLLFHPEILTSGVLAFVAGLGIMVMGYTNWYWLDPAYIIAS